MSRTSSMTPVRPPTSRRTTAVGAVLAMLAALFVTTVVVAPAAHADATAPTAPQYVSAYAWTRATAGELNVSWSAPASDGGAAVTSYSVTRTGASPVSVAAGVTSYQFTGLTPGATYSVSVTATNSVGTSAAASTSASLLVAPAAPSTVTAVAGNGQASLSWSDPTDSWFSQIDVYANGSSTPSFTSEGYSVNQQATITGLTNGVEYTFKVRAGGGNWGSPNYYTATSGASNAVTPWPPIELPATPATPTATATSTGNLKVTWAANAPIDRVQSYTVTASPGGASTTVSGAVTMANFYGLTAGTNYTFTVTATNSLGTSSASAASTPKVPGSAPSAPQYPSAYAWTRATAGEVTVSWSAPANDGGSPVTSYSVTRSGAAPVTVSGSTTSYKFTGLTPGATYNFNVSATNAFGTSTVTSWVPATLLVAPAAPSTVTAVAGDGQVALTWSDPTDSWFSQIDVYANGSSTPSFTSEGYSVNQQATITGLTNGTSYTFKVRAGGGNWGSPNYYTATSGASNAVTPLPPLATPSTPATPTVTTTGIGNLQVTWAANPVVDRVQNYTVTASPGGASTTVSGAVTTANFYGLTAGTNYTFTVTASNSMGTSGASGASAAKQPGALPSAPQYPSAYAWTRATAGEINLSWSAPASDGGSAVTGYTVTRSGGTSVTLPATTTSYKFTGLTPGATYSVSVTAMTAFGTSSAASTSATLLVAPAAPSTVTAVAGNGQVALSWSDPTDSWFSQIDVYANGSFLRTDEGYSVNQQATIAGLTNGVEYTFRVRAGGGNWGSPNYYTATSGVSNAVTPWPPLATPDAPAAPTVTATAIGSLKVTWAANAAVDRVQNYTVTASPGGASTTVTGAVTSATFNGLTAGTDYTFTVTASNSAGTSASSAASVAKKPGALPSVPQYASAYAWTRATAGEVNVSWSAPASDGGSAVTSYTVTRSGASPVTVSGSTTSYKFTGLTPGATYSFTVQATNAFGSSAASTSVSATLLVAPAAPSTVTAVAGNGQVALSWSDPTDSWFSQIDVYANGSFVRTDEGYSVGQQATITGLTNGVEYTFKVRAGGGNWGSPNYYTATSGSSNAVTPHS